MVLLGVPAIGKFVDLQGFSVSLSHWELIPTSIRTPLAFVVPIAELAIAVSWFAMGFRNRSAWCAVLLLVVFTGGLVAHIRFANPPNCDCFGLWQKFFDMHSSAEQSVVRNGFLVLALVVGIALRTSIPTLTSRPRQRTSPEDTSVKTPLRRTASSPPGFSLIEMIVVVGILGVLISLSMPMLKMFRENARDAADVANLRTHTLTVSMYAADWKDSHPAPLKPNLEEQTITHPIVGEADLWYFWTKSLWHWPLIDTYCPLTRGSPFNGPRKEETYFTQYWFSSSLMARPSFWNLRTRTGPEQWGATKTSEIRTPSQKAVFLDFHVFEIEQPLGRTAITGNGVRMGFADGSAAQVRLADCTKPVITGEGFYHPGSQIGPGIIGLHTKDGVNGRDVTRR